ncbi:MAG TPA: peptidoglycan-binding protein, partial [Bradyrhizobium sp.]|nr:peptidoglycan-binding protein [Bradyrhizobium sp.]
MLRMTTVAMTAMLAAAPAFGQSTLSPIRAADPAPAHASPAKPAAAASTPEARSATALALSHEPTYDEGSAQRIREAALSYSDLAVRGGWPVVPADAKFALGVQGANDDLLRKRLIISGDLAADKASGPYDDVLAEAVKRFQVRHGLAGTGTVTPRTLAAPAIDLG